MNKEEKKLDWDKPLRTVGKGYPVRLLCKDLKTIGTVKPFKYALAAFTEDGSEYLTYCRDDGTTLSGTRIENVPEKQERWMNIYSNLQVRSTNLHKTKEEADKTSTSDRIARIKIEWEEGQFDE